MKKNLSLLFIIIFLFSWWSNPSLIPKTSPDTGGYVRMANDFSDEISEMRPFLFPLLIRFCMAVAPNSWEQLFCLIQISFHSLVSILLFFLFHNFQIKKNIAFILTLIIGFNPSLIFYSTYLLADHFLAVLTTVSWLFSIKYIINYNKSQKISSDLLFMGLFSGLAAVTKPVALYSIFPLIFAFVFTVQKSKYIMKPIIILLVMNFSINIVWEEYKKYNDPETSFEAFDILEYHINMIAIRGGLIDYGQGTPLYMMIEEKKLLDIARKFNIELSYTMDTQPGFMKFKNSLSWDIKNDEEFAIKILQNAPLKLFFSAISNWHSFFTKRCFSPGNGSFPHMPESIRYLYVTGYGLLYRPFLILLILISFFILWKMNYKSLLFPSGSIVLYASLCIGILTPHGGEFPRYRVWIEYIMWFCAVIPIGYLMQFLIDKGRRVL